jgi:hypothetical protein
MALSAIRVRVGLELLSVFRPSWNFGLGHLAIGPFSEIFHELFQFFGLDPNSFSESGQIWPMGPISGTISHWAQFSLRFFNSQFFSFLFSGEQEN